ncbi:hypothetical protein [Mucilaginibacter sp.]|uniref:hypothetical protein n=1 Tax=Mucilaginibacter sp. TaxID=1882438 RepID=UPI00261FD39E|nr:hypothetical protein [Mucilaginibacter sp.]MDB5127239.1 hypothetical protein [Mucilaginibacter sp.]
MNKKSALILLLVIFTSCSKKSKSELEKSNLKGDITQLTINKYKAETKFGEIVKGKIQQHFLSKFNSFGNTEFSDITYYYGDADSAEVYNHKSSFQYDEQGHNIKTTSVSNPKKYSLKKFNGNLLIEKDDIDGKKIESKTKYVYNSDGFISEVNRYDSNGKFTGKEKHITNSKGLDTEIQIYKSTGELEYKFVVSYDDNDNVLTEKQTVGEYPFSSSYKYSNLDNKGNWLKAISYRDGKPLEYIERIIKFR